MQRAQEEKNHGEHWDRGSIEGGTTMEHRERMGCTIGHRDGRAGHVPSSLPTAHCMSMSDAHPAAGGPVTPPGLVSPIAYRVRRFF